MQELENVQSVFGLSFLTGGITAFLIDRFHSHQRAVFLPQTLPTLHALGVDGNTVHGTNLHALGLIVMSHALSALGGIDLIDELTQKDGIIGTFGLTNITVDAFISNHQSHESITPSVSACCTTLLICRSSNLE